MKLSYVFCHLILVLSLLCCISSSGEQFIEIVEPTRQPATTVIFLHGTGENGSEMKTAIQDLIGNFSVVPNLRFIFPTARPITFSPPPWNGSLLTTWFDIDEFRLDAVENTENVEQAAEDLKNLINEQIQSGIPPRKICVVGFARGGTMALHMGYEYTKNLGCVSAMSSWLPTTSELYSRLMMTPRFIGRRLPPVYFSIGDLDPLVSLHWVENTARLFQSAGVTTFVDVWEGIPHEMTKAAIENLLKFIEISTA